MLAVLGPYAATGVEDRGVVRRDRSTPRELTDRSVRFANPYRREDGRVFAASALDYGYRCGERDERYSGEPQEFLRSQISAHQWNI
jgi:hypothetical protein